MQLQPEVCLTIARELTSNPAQRIAIELVAPIGGGLSCSKRTFPLFAACRHSLGLRMPFFVKYPYLPTPLLFMA